MSYWKTRTNKTDSREWYHKGIQGDGVWGMSERALCTKAKVRVICGKAGGKKGPVQDIITDPEYLDIAVPARSEFAHPTKRGHTVFAYVIEGKGCFCKEKPQISYEIEGVNYFDIQREPFVSNETLVLFEDGDQMMVSTEGEAVRFLLISGKSIAEPEAWYGPVVMNTEDELWIVSEEYRNGTFVECKRV